MAAAKTDLDADTRSRTLPFTLSTVRSKVSSPHQLYASLSRRASRRYKSNRCRCKGRLFLPLGSSFHIQSPLNARVSCYIEAALRTTNQSARRFRDAHTSSLISPPSCLSVLKGTPPDMQSDTWTRSKGNIGEGKLPPDGWTLRRWTGPELERGARHVWILTRGICKAACDDATLVGAALCAATAVPLRFDVPVARDRWSCDRMHGGTPCFGCFLLSVIFVSELSRPT